MKRNKKLLQQLQQNWAKPKETAFNFNNIEELFTAKEAVPSPYTLTDRTAEDLDFFEFFKFIDRTTSAVGQQYLYQHLRQLKYTPSYLHELEERIEFYNKEANKRLETQTILHGLSTQNDYYFPFLMYGALPTKLSFYWLIRLLQMLFFGGVLLAIVNPAFVIPLILLFSVHLFLHYWHKNRIGNFATIFSRLVRLTSTAKKLLKDSHLPKSAAADLQGKVKRIEKITAKVLFLKTHDLQDNMIGSFLWFITELFKIASLGEITTFHSIVDKMETNRGEVEDLFVFIGEVDIAISIASLRTGLPYYSQAQWIVTKKEIAVVDLYHPLVPNCVGNDLHLVDKSLLLTGSNMSGKSTFIRAVNLNAIAAQTLNTSFTKSYTAPFFALATSIRITDDLTDNKSYYMEEVNTIGQLLAFSKTEDAAFLFTIDEVFKGTNTIERISAAKAILGYLNKGQHIILVSTHDIELTTLLSEGFDLHYFQESIEAETLSFDYKLKKGALQKKNAIRILEIAGYPKEVIAEAQELSVHFEKEKTGW